MFPLRCPLCGADMRLVAFITDAATVRDILAHLGAPTAPPHLPVSPVASTRDNLIRGQLVGLKLPSVIVGRAKDLIITGGLNVYPKEIEERIDALAGVVESAVIGVPDADFGEAVAAVIVARSDHGLTESGVIAALKGEIANFKVPKRVHFVAQLPRNAMGKVQKNVLREKFGAAV